MAEPIYQNHVVDPTYFYDAIEEFAFNYNWFVKNSENVDDYGRVVSGYDQKIIRGSLQSQGSSIIQEKTGNKIRHDYNFYCKSLYRINKYDIIQYKDNYYMVTEVHDYDEWGVRSASLSIITLTEHKDFNDYLEYLNGTKLV